MRFEIGQQIPFIKVKFSRRPDTKFMFQNLFDPRIHNLVSIEVKMLTVKEHHKVPWCHEPDGEKKYDGFIFTEQLDDDKEQIWYNQYPTASYGQLDDTSDRIVFRHLEHTNEEITKMSNEEVDIWLERWYTALDFIANIKRAIDGGERYALELTPEDKKLFEDYLFKVQETIEKVSGKKIEFNIATYKSKEGVVTELKGYWEAKLV